MNERIKEIEIDLEVTQNEQSNKPFRTVAAYFVFGFLWILFSDKILSLLVTNQHQYQSIQTYKGWIYVLITSIGLYFIIKLDYKRIFKLNSDISLRNQQLVAYNEELIAMEEDLNQKIGVLYQTTEALDEQKKYVYEIYNSSNAIIMVWNLKGEILDINEQFGDLLGYKLDDIKGKLWLDFLIPPSSEPVVRDMIQRLKINHRVSHVENKVYDIKGSEFDILWNNALIQNPITGEPNVVSFGMDVTLQKKTERDMLKLAYIDELTGLQNSVVFDARLENYITIDKPFVIYYIDIDDFKRLNDIHGHQTGNYFLKQYAKALKNKFPNLEMFRWCEDEFLMIEQIYHKSQREKRISEIQAMTWQPWELNGVAFTPSISIGTTIYPEDGSDAETLMMTMDMALYKAKSIGKNCVVNYEESLQKEVEKMIRIEHAIENALKNNAFQLYYQPIFDMVSHEVKTLEMLLRWQDNPLNISTQDFIDVAEETGHIKEIDAWVIENTFFFIQNILGANTGYNVAINLSVQTFKSSDLLKFLETMVERYCINPALVEFEITEYSFIEDFEQAKSAVVKLKEMGFRITLDDFGTRFSSINYLVQMPFDQLKIDKSYIDGVVTNSDHLKVVDHIIKLAHDLGLKTVAEGIEEELQYSKLMQLGCDFGQGYLMAHPVDINALKDKAFSEKQRIFKLNNQ